MELVFQYRFGGAGYGCVGMPAGKSLAVYANGDVVLCKYVLGKDEPVSRKVLAVKPELASAVAEIIACHADELSGIPDTLDNGTLDGSEDCLTFGDKIISAWCIHRTNPEDASAELDAAYRKNMEYENAVLDIYDEIAVVINRHHVGIQLPVR